MMNNHMDLNNPYKNHQYLFELKRNVGAKLCRTKTDMSKIATLRKDKCFECGGFNIFFNGVTIIECHNCQEAIVKRSYSVALDKEGCEVDQDVKLLLKDLEMF